MKLLLDQNLSRRIITHIADQYPDSRHVASVLGEAASDRDIWFCAQENEFIIVTKDDDFEQRSILLGHPPKVVWIRLGNCKTRDVIDLLLASAKTIYRFGNDGEKSILPLP